MTPRPQSGLQARHCPQVGVPWRVPSPTSATSTGTGEPLPRRGGLQPWDVVAGPGRCGGQRPKTPVRSEMAGADSSLPTPRRIPEQKPGAPCWPGAEGQARPLCSSGGLGNHHHNQGSGRALRRTFCSRWGQPLPRAWAEVGRRPGDPAGLGLRLCLVTVPLALQGVGDFAV